MEPCGKTLRIAAADTFRLDYLRRVFRADLLEAVRAVSSTLPGVELETVEFVFDAAAKADCSVEHRPPSKDSPLAQEAATMDGEVNRRIPVVAGAQRNPHEAASRTTRASDRGEQNEKPL